MTDLADWIAYERAVLSAAESGSLTGLALSAALAEVAIMLPYLGGIGLLAAASCPAVVPSIARRLWKTPGSAW
ncbi:hypothetical protein [Actinoplanes sp. NPDC051859]|uniref:hypothetical protein n=1 Tax=Actinoplanes sp. NPDC051859 TaxID=3363909 RepID=UPI00379F6082